MMKDYTSLVRPVHLYLEASNLILDILPLQHQIQVCNDELTALLTFGQLKSEADRVHELQDEIFGCKIEIQSLRVKARRLVNQAQLMRFSEFGQKVERRPYSFEGGSLSK
jgi:hypothetical protein